MNMEFAGRCRPGCLAAHGEQMDEKRSRDKHGRKGEEGIICMKRHPFTATTKSDCSTTNVNPKYRIFPDSVARRRKTTGPFHFPGMPSPVPVRFAHLGSDSGPKRGTKSKNKKKKKTGRTQVRTGDLSICSRLLYH